MDTASYVLLATMAEEGMLDASLTVLVSAMLLASVISIASSVALGYLPCALRDPPAMMLRLVHLPSPALLKIVLLPFTTSALQQATVVALSELFAVRRGVVGLCMFQTLNRGAFALATASTVTVGVLTTVTTMLLLLLVDATLVTGWNALETMFTVVTVVAAVSELGRNYLVARMSFSYVKESLPAGA